MTILTPETDPQHHEHNGAAVASQDDAQQLAFDHIVPGVALSTETASAVTEPVPETDDVSNAGTKTEERAEEPDAVISSPEPLSEENSIESDASTKEGVEQPRSGIKRFWKPLLAVTLAGAGAFAALGGGGGNSEATKTETPVATAPKAPSNASGQPAGQKDNSVVVPEKSPNTVNPEASIDKGVVQTPESTGNSAAINLKDVPLGNNFLTVVRPNGEKIQLPAEITGKTPEEITSSALALFAGYLTTGDQRVLDAFTNDPDVQDGLRSWRQRDIAPVLTKAPDNKNMQVVVYEDPNKPAVLETSADGTVISLVGGTLYYGRFVNSHGSNEWQHPDTHPSYGVESKFRGLTLHLLPSGKGYKVRGFEWDIKPTVES